MYGCCDLLNLNGICWKLTLIADARRSRDSNPLTAGQEKAVRRRSHGCVRVHPRLCGVTFRYSHQSWEKATINRTSDHSAERENAGQAHVPYARGALISVSMVAGVHNHHAPSGFKLACWSLGLHCVAPRVPYCSISSHPSWSPEKSGGHYRSWYDLRVQCVSVPTNDGGVRAGQVVSAAT